MTSASGMVIIATTASLNDSCLSFISPCIVGYNYSVRYSSKVLLFSHSPEGQGCHRWSPALDRESIGQVGRVGQVGRLAQIHEALTASRHP